MYSWQNGSKSIETRWVQLSKPLHPYLSASLLSTFENCPVDLFNNLRKQSNITHGRGGFLVQTQNTYFGQKFKPLSTLFRTLLISNVLIQLTDNSTFNNKFLKNSSVLLGQSLSILMNLCISLNFPTYPLSPS